MTARSDFVLGRRDTCAIARAWGGVVTVSAYRPWFGGVRYTACDTPYPNRKPSSPSVLYRIRVRIKK